ncbi:MAG: HAMP domain-containing sensor histidine kinase [Elusimicrobia bacterium]|nr:HAMP domain-containing sensor histidine kinase [Elusimicrobiota bacterium]
MEQSQYELIRRIASVVGHELRNPLAVINNSAYFVKTKLGAVGQKDPKVEKHLGIIASEIARADRLISDILRFSRALEVKLAPTGLTAVVEAALKDCVVPDGVKVKREKPKSEATVQADAAALAEAVRRILDNALEAAGPAGTVTVSWGARGGDAFVEVRDTGPGIKPEDLAKVLHPFFTTKPRGLGLGLAMAEKIAAAHGGRVEAKNSPGGGAALTVTLPKA